MKLPFEKQTKEILNIQKFFKKVSKVALPPGTLVEREGVADKEPKISLIDYTQDEYVEKTLSKIEDSFSFKDKHSVTWINIEGMNIETIKKIDDYFGIHPLVAEDIINLGQRPKIEDHEDYLFIVIKMLHIDRDQRGIDSEQISLLVGKNYVISFQEREGDVFGPIRDRIKNGKGRIRSMEADYLAYSLLDAIVDHYFVILEKIGEEIEVCEERMLKDGDSDISHLLLSHKRDMVYLRKQIWPLREVLSSLQRGESKLIKKTTNVYLRDVYDHAIQVIDTIESFRDMITGLHDMHMTIISNKMNEVMKVLTIFAAIFIPLTFMAGIYGMNFDNIPELHWKNGYYMLLGIMAVITLIMLAFFKRKKWL